MEHQDPPRRRRCPYGDNVLAVAGPSARCARGSRAAEAAGRPQPAAAPADGSCVRGNETRQLALDLGFIPVVPPLRTRVEPWEYDRAMYKRRNEVERLFRRLKGYRRIFSRFEKLDVMFTAFISFALIADSLRLC